MAFGTPWAVGGGASHEVEIARQQTYDATGGAEGISRPGNLKVQPLAVPGTKVRVAPGGALLVNRYPGGDGQSYTIRNDVQVEVDVASTGSGGGRSDLVVARITDPQYEGQPPADPDDFDYAGVDIIQGVPSSTRSARDLNLNYPAVALARIDLPASTGTVTAAHITDLRELARPREKTYMRTYALTGEDTDRLNSATGDQEGEAWPNVFWVLRVPEWAQRVRVRGFWAQVRMTGSSANAYGRIWVRVGSMSDPDGFNSQFMNWDTPQGTGVVRQTWVCPDDLAVPAGMRGREIQFHLRGSVNGGSGTERPQLDSVSGISLDVEFYEATV